jgi:protoheme IX farnesyltransferase
MPLPAAPVARSAPSAATVVHALIEMTKWRLSSLVLVTTAAGYWLAIAPGAPALTTTLLWTLIGSALAAFGANAFNQCLEYPRDRQMARTCGRPIPSGRVSLPLALAWSVGLHAAGVGLLAGLVGPLPALLALLVGALYVAAYTPLKPTTSLATLIGAVCGAIPPMIGWAAVDGRLAPGAWLLFGILFVWQIPHFLAIDWYHREDYARGGFRMVSTVDPSGRFGSYLIVVYCLALLPITLLAAPLGLGGFVYLAGAIVLGLGFTGLGVALWAQRTRQAARRLFLGSLVYLPVLLALLLLDRSLV